MNYRENRLGSSIDYTFVEDLNWESDIQMDNERIHLVVCKEKKIEKYILLSRTHHVPEDWYVFLKNVAKEEKGHRPITLGGVTPYPLTHLPPPGKLAKRILQDF